MTNMTKESERATSPSIAERASEAASSSKEELRIVVGDAKSHARTMVAESRDSLWSEATNQAARLSSLLRDVGRQLTSMADGQHGGGVAVDISRQLASTAVRAADRLESGGVDGTLADVKRFARRRPGLFMIGAVGAGIAAGRLLKAADTQSLMEKARGEIGGAPEPTNQVGWAVSQNELAASTATTPDLGYRSS